MLKKIAALVFFTALPVLSQVAAPAGNTPQPQAGASQTQPMPYGMTQALGQVDQVAQTSVRDLGRVRVDKWKTDNRDKDQSRSNAESLQRNLTSALPTLVQQVRANPTSLAASIKLYRNLNALYDVMAAFAESAGAFGSKDDYNALANDVSNLDSVRRAVADQLEQMAGNQDAQVVRLTQLLQARQQAATAAAAVPPKKVVVDDTVPAKKTAAKKKPAATPKSQ